MWMQKIQRWDGTKAAPEAEETVPSDSPGPTSQLSSKNPPEQLLML